MNVLIIVHYTNGFKNVQRIDDVTSVQDSMELYMLMHFDAHHRNEARELFGYFTEPKGGYFGNP